MVHDDLLLAIIQLHIMKANEDVFNPLSFQETETERGREDQIFCSPFLLVCFPHLKLSVPLWRMNSVWGPKQHLTGLVILLLALHILQQTTVTLALCHCWSVERTHLNKGIPIFFCCMAQRQHTDISARSSFNPPLHIIRDHLSNGALLKDRVLLKHV